MFSKKPVHFFNRLHIPLRILVQPETGFLYRAFFPDAGQDVLQSLPEGAW
jgi:hypothetical protein